MHKLLLKTKFQYILQTEGERGRRKEMATKKKNLFLMNGIEEF